MKAAILITMKFAAVEISPSKFMATPIFQKMF